MMLIPKEYNYVAAFLTLDCNFRCTYCINRPENACAPRSVLSGQEWLAYLNRLELSNDLPISFQGGEPSLHPDFFEILNGLKKQTHIDVLTNLSFDVERLAREIPAQRFFRQSPYPAIRVTYHPGQSDLEKTLTKIVYLRERGYPIGLYSIEAPGHEALIEKVRLRTAALGIDYRTKEYLGLTRGKIFGTYHYDDAVFKKGRKAVSCRTSELLISPDGSVYRCHRDLYLNEHQIGSIRGSLPFSPEYVFRSCANFGDCNPCDMKKKTNRFQQSGHASVEVRF